jgi:hypothetical protein
VGKYTERRSGQRRVGGGSINVSLIVGAVAVVLAGLGSGFFFLKRDGSHNQTDQTTGCLINRNTPEAMLVLVDETDKLSRENSERIRTHIVDKVNALPRYSRLTIVPFGGDIATPLKPIFDQCLPGRGDDAGMAEGALILKKKYEEFTAALDGLVDQIQEIPDSKMSPITEQVVRAASDEVLHWQGQTRSLYLVTDGLESSIYWTKALQLKEPTEGILKDVKAEYFEVGNSKAARLQTRELREKWKSWLTSAGAEVRMNAPGYPAS